MPAAVRGRGLLVAVGFPTAALLCVALWFRLHGVGISTSLPAAVVLVCLAGLAEQINLVVSPRLSVSVSGVFVAAAALVGGPLVGACAGAATSAFELGAVRRKRFAWGGASALEGFCIGVVGQQLAFGGGGARALALAGLGLLTGMVINACNTVIVALDRGRVPWREITACCPSHLLVWALPSPPLVAFLFAYPRASYVSLALAGGLLSAIWFANRIRLQLEQSLAEERLRARLDALTSAPNRYALAEALTAEHSRIMRGGRPAAVCFLDLDLFRDVNNTYGYAAGDELLVSVYRRLRERLRASDGIFRWGGEEFVVLAPDHADLAELAERLRQLVGRQPFTIRGRELRVTCSVGAARLDEFREPDASLEAASRLVRVAKERRNAVQVETGVPRASSRAGPAQALDATVG